MILSRFTESLDCFGRMKLESMGNLIVTSTTTWPAELTQVFIFALQRKTLDLKIPPRESAFA
jgi:hypothetical protein